jgi:hypothetical protein
LPAVFIGDVNCDNRVNLTDITRLIGYVYMEQPPPCD